MNDMDRSGQYLIVIEHNKSLKCVISTKWRRQAFCVTGLSWGESTGDRWIPLTKGQ